MPRFFIAGTIGTVLGFATNGCALRATTDFGPQSALSRQSISAAPEGLPGLPILRGDSGGTLGVRSGGYNPGIGASPFSSDDGAAGSAGGR